MLDLELEGGPQAGSPGWTAHEGSFVFSLETRVSERVFGLRG